MAGAASLVATTPAMAAGKLVKVAPHKTVAAIPRKPERMIHLVNAHTEEQAQLVYWRNGKYLPDAMRQIARVMRDHNNNSMHQMDPHLMDLLVDLRRSLGTSEPFTIISGYRSPATNRRMVATSPGVAPHSLHMEGKAVDVMLPGHNIDTVHRAALNLAEGGVGYYPRSGFVHVDTGKVRQWQFG